MKNKVSLLSFLKDGQSLPQLSSNEIHYPESGAAHLREAEVEHFWFLVRRELILKLLKTSGIKEKSVGLDIGCGSGYTAVWLSEKGYPTLGVDGHKNFGFYEKQKKALGFLAGNILAIEPSSEFDFILLLDVIEHIENDKEFLIHSLKFLKPGGVAIITVPAFQSLWSKVDDNSGHRRRYSKNDFKNLAENTGSQIIHSNYFYAMTTIPFILSRRFSKSNNETASSELAPSLVINSVLRTVLRFEALFSSFQMTPFGTSLFVVLRKS